MAFDLCCNTEPLWRALIPGNLAGPAKTRRRLYLPVVLLLVALFTAVPGMAASEKASDSGSKASDAENVQPEGLAELI